jgi:hypothetical protein
MLGTLDNNSQLSILLFLPLISRLALRTTSNALKQQIDHLHTTTPAFAIELTFRNVGISDINSALSKTSSMVSVSSVKIIKGGPWFAALPQFHPIPPAHRHSSAQPVLKTLQVIHIYQISHLTCSNIVQLHCSIQLIENQLKNITINQIPTCSSLAAGPAAPSNPAAAPFPALETLSVLNGSRGQDVFLDETFFSIFLQSPLRSVDLNAGKTSRTILEFAEGLCFPQRLETLSFCQNVKGAFYHPDEISVQDLAGALERLPNLRMLNVYFHAWGTLVDILEGRQSPKQKYSIPYLAQLTFDDVYQCAGVHLRRRLLRVLPNLSVDFHPDWLNLGIKNFHFCSLVQQHKLKQAFESRSVQFQKQEPRWHTKCVKLDISWKMLHLSPEGREAIEMAREKYPMLPVGGVDNECWKKWDAVSWLIWATCMVIVSSETTFFDVSFRVHAKDEKGKEKARAVMDLADEAFVVACRMKEMLDEDGPWKRDQQLAWHIWCGKILKSRPLSTDLPGWCRSSRPQPPVPKATSCVAF